MQSMGGQSAVLAPGSSGGAYAVDAARVLRGILESSDDPFAAVAPDLRLVAFNAAFRRWFSEAYGAVPELDQTIEQLLDRFPADRATVADLCRRALAGEAFRLSQEFVGQDNQKKHFEATLKPVTDPAGEMTVVTVVLRDVTERWLSEQKLRNIVEATPDPRMSDRRRKAPKLRKRVALQQRRRGQRREDRLAFLAEIAEDFAHLSLPEELLCAVGARIGAYLGVSVCVFAQIEEALDKAIIEYAWRRTPGAPKVVGEHQLSALANDEFLKAARTGETVVVRDTQSDPRADAGRCAAVHVRAFVAVPFHRAAWKYLLGVGDAGPRDWREEEIELIRQVTDLTFPRLERAHGEQALRASREMFQSLFESAPAAIVVIDAERGRIVRTNRQAEAMFAYTADELRGQSADILLAERYREAFPEFRGGTLTQPPPHPIGIAFEFCGRRKDGSEFPADITLGTQQTDAGTISLAIICDNSERQRAEAERQARLAAEAAAVAKSAFLANMSHELRSPMNTILGFVRLMANDPGLPNGAREDLERILKSCEHLYAVVNQVLDLSKLEAGHATLNEADFDLHLLLDDLHGLFLPAATAKGLHLRFARRPNVPNYVRSDALKLRQVLINLLDNAIKFTATGSISLAVELAADRPGSDVAEPTRDSVVRLRFTVTDTGPGIAAEELDNLFGAFVQAEAGRRQPHGTGLGLAISRGFVRVLGGEMQLESALSVGTTARFELPVRVVAKPAAVIETRFRRVLGLAHGQPRYRLLVADDQAEARELIARDLAPLGFAVREVGNGLEAIAAWRHWRPHLIWMNLSMPVLDGLEATRRIRAGPMGRYVVIIGVSAGIAETERSAALAAGCNDIVRKPLREADLFAALEKHLQVRFLFEEALPAAAQPLDPHALAKLPEAQRAALRDALLRLEVESVERTIESIRASDAGIADALAARAHEFQYESILAGLRGEPDDKDARGVPASER